MTIVIAYTDSVSSNSINKHWDFCVAPSPSATTRFVRENQSHLRQVCTDFCERGSRFNYAETWEHCLAVCSSCCARVKQNCKLPDAPFHDTGLSGLATCCHTGGVLAFTVRYFAFISGQRLLVDYEVE